LNFLNPTCVSILEDSQTYYFLQKQFLLH